MLTSSLLVRATMISASAAPAASSTGGYAALPTTVWISRRSCRSRSTSSLTSTTVTSFASSRERCRATVRPTCPAPRMRIFIPGAQRSNRYEVGILHHQPLGALLLEVYLYPRVRAAPFDIQHDALAELAVPHPRAEAHPGRRRLLGPEPDGGRRRLLTPRPGRRHGTADVQARPHLRDDVLRHLLDEARGCGMSVHAVHPALLRVGEV